MATGGITEPTWLPNMRGFLSLVTDAIEGSRVKFHSSIVCLSTWDSGNSGAIFARRVFNTKSTFQTHRNSKHSDLN